MNVALIVATFGNEHPWADLARERAWPSAYAELGRHFEAYGVLHHFPDLTLAQARNEAAKEPPDNVEWLCFLDADDELEPGYIDAMEAAWRHGAITTDWSPLLVPAVRYTAGDAPPAIPNRGGWPTVNECVVGTLVRRSMFEAVGGFRDRTDDGTTISIYEDWDLWLRCDAQHVYVHDAVYRANGGPGGSGRNLGLAMKGTAAAVYEAIWRDHLARGGGR